MKTSHASWETSPNLSGLLLVACNQVMPASKKVAICNGLGCHMLAQPVVHLLGRQSQADKPAREMFLAVVSSSSPCS